MLSPRKIECPSDADIERSAYNAAFYELGLRWYWDDATYERLAAESCELAGAAVPEHVQPTCFAPTTPTS